MLLSYYYDNFMWSLNEMMHVKHLNSVSNTQKQKLAVIITALCRLQNTFIGIISH